MTDQINLRTTCRACTGSLSEILNLGNLRLNAFPTTVEEIQPIPQVPLILTVCRECGLAQLDRTVPADWMYRHYWYRSGINESMITELRSIVTEISLLVPLSAQDVVLDIGANDGTLLTGYTVRGGYLPYRIAVEPALNLHLHLKDHCDELIPDYFPSKALERYQGKISAITAIACAYDLEDPTAFFQSIHDLLAPGGVAVIQFQDLGQQIESSAFDNVVHEHLEYYTLWSLWGILQQARLTIQRCTRTPINGGSLRVIVRRVEDRIRPELNVTFQLSRESQQFLDTPAIRGGNLHAFDTFRWRVEQVKRQILSAVQHALDQGAVIDQWGASTKGNITLQVLGLGPGQIRQAVDRSPEKVGYFTITGIPIVCEETAEAAPADLAFVTAWQFRESLLRRGQWFLDRGGSILFPLPAVEIVRKGY